jgi:hypothetical protein
MTELEAFQLLMSRRVDPPRDVATACSYTIAPTITHFWDAFLRNGIAARVISFKPKATWQVKPTIIARDKADATGEEENEWEKKVRTTVSDSDLWSTAATADMLSRVGSYGIVVLAIDDRRLFSEPVDGYGNRQIASHKLMYARAHSEKTATVKTWDQDQTSPRYGQPLTYTVRSDVGPKSEEFECHWHRVVHIAEDAMGSIITHVPALARLYNWVVTDLEKLVGGSIEAYWQCVFPAYFFSAREGVDVTEDEKKELEIAAAKFVDSAKRWMLTAGMEAKALTPAWEDPQPGLQMLLQLIALSEDCPQRVFLGTEEGRLAGDKDNTEWGMRILQRRDGHAGPRIVRPLINTLTFLGVLPRSESGFDVAWRVTAGMNPKERAEFAKMMTDAIVGYVRGGGSSLMPEVTYLTRILGFTQSEAESILAQVEDALLKELQQSEDDLMDGEQTVDPDSQGPTDSTDEEDLNADTSTDKG